MAYSTTIRALAQSNLRKRYFDKEILHYIINMPIPSNIIRQIMDDSKNCLHCILASNKADDQEEVTSLAHQIAYSQNICTFPFFLTREFKYESPFAAFWIRRFIRRGLLNSNPLRLTTRGRGLAPRGVLGSIPDLEPIEHVLSYSEIPPESLRVGSRTVRIRPNIGDFPLILTALLPPDPAFFFIFSHFDRDGMRTFYPLWKEGDTFISLFMGDIRNVFSVPESSLLDNCWASFNSYMGRYVSGFRLHLKIIVHLLLSISRIRFAHRCGLSVKLLNNLTDEIKQLIDFTPCCSDCGMAPGNHINLINLRHRLGHSWAKGILSELFFSKLVTHEMSSIDSSINVYPRLTIEDLPHECDVFVKWNNTIIIFELKRSVSLDGWCKEGIKQLSENKQMLENCGIDCKAILVTNMNSRDLPDHVEIQGESISNEVDEHFIPDDILDLASRLESLV